MKPDNFARRVLWRVALISLGLLVLHLGLQWLNLHYDQKQGQVYEISNRVDFDDEVSLPSWYAQFLLLGVAVTAWIAARFANGGPRKAWRLVAVIGLLMAIDEASGLHEFVLQSAHLLYYGEVVPTAALNAWWLALPFIVVLGGWLLWWLSRTLPARTVKLFLLAGLVYVAGAAGFELVSNDVAKSSFMYQGVMTGAEEVLELLGTCLGLYAILDYLQTHQAAKLTTLRKALSSKG